MSLLGMTKLFKMKPVIQTLGQETRALKFKLQSTRSLLGKSVKNHNEQMQKVCNKNTMQLLCSCNLNKSTAI